MTSTDQRHEAQQDHDARMAGAFSDLCPHIIGNPFIPHFPLPQQAIFLGLHQWQTDRSKVFECLYGGAAGGGKSDALLMGAAQTAWGYPGSSSILFRRTYTQLAQTGALMDRAMQWWGKDNGAHWNGSDKLFTFPNGSRVKMAYHSNPRDNDNYQGAEFQFVAFDEITHWPDDSAYLWVALSRVRRLAGSEVPLRALCSSNPGGVGHSWVKRRFIGGVNLETGLYEEPHCAYVPARLADNPHLDGESYELALNQLHPTVREQLLEGNWEARDPGDYFRAEWFGPLLDPIKDAWPECDKISIRWWDLAASEKPGACYTAGVLMSRHSSGVRAIEHCNSFRATPGKRDSKIIQQAQADGHRVTVGIEIEGGSGGIAQYQALEKRLRSEGFRVVGARPRSMTGAEKAGELLIRAPSSDSAKAARCDPVTSCLERGYQRRGESDLESGSIHYGEDRGRHHTAERDGIRLYVGSWTQAFLDVIEGFPDSPRKDEVDGISGAWAWLEAHPFGHRVAGGGPKTVHSSNSHDLHPSERKEPRDLRRDRHGFLTP